MKNIKKSFFRFLAINALRFDTFYYKLLSLLCIMLNRVILHYFNKYPHWFASKLHKDDVVLDIGSKFGDMCDFMSNSCKYVYGIEIDNSSYRKSLMLYSDKSNLEFLNADAITYRYTSLSRQITVVTLSNVLEHIEDRPRFLKLLLASLNTTNFNHKIKILIRVPLIERDWIPCYKQHLG